jgi:molecular chaperone DnaK (HSP70)
MYPGIDFGTSKSNASYSDGAHIYLADGSTTGHPAIPSAIFVAAQGDMLVGTKQCTAELENCKHITNRSSHIQRRS